MPLDAARRQQVIDRTAHRLAGLGLTAPAVLFLEMHKPLAFLGSAGPTRRAAVSQPGFQRLPTFAI